MRFRHLALPTLLGLLALIVLAVPHAGATYYPGDIVVSTSDTRSGQTIDIAGSIYIQSGASASWTDVNVTFNSTSPSAHGIYIDGSTNVDFLRVNIGIVPGTTLYWFRVNASANFQAESSDFGWMNGSATDPGASATGPLTDFSALVGGVQVYSSAARIGNSTIHDGRGTNLYISGSAPRINNNHIFDARYIPFEYATSYSAPRQTSDYRAVAACVVQASGAADLDTNRIERCGAESSANATDLGGSGASQATSNLRLVGAGVVALGGVPSMIRDGILEIANFSSASRSFTLGNVSVTQNLVRLASWGGLFKGVGGAVVGGGFVSGVGTALEFYQDGTYSGGMATFDLYSVNFNGSYTTGLQAQFRDHNQAVSFTVDGFAFGPGPAFAAVVQFINLGNSHSAILKNSAVDTNGAGVGFDLYDAGSTGTPSMEVASNTFARVRAPISIHLEGLDAGASLNINHNTFDQTSGVSNVSATPTQRGAIDVRWVNVLLGTLDLKVDSNTITTQNWQMGGSFGAGITLYSSQSHQLVTNFFVRGNAISNVSEGLYIYENYGVYPQSSSFNISSNTIRVASDYGMYLFSSSNAGTSAPDLDFNTIDRAQSYAVIWQISSGTISASTFGNNTVLGTGTSRCCGLYFVGNANKWPLTLSDTNVSNSSFGLLLSQVNAYIIKSNISANGQGISCTDCTARLEGVEIYELSAQVSGIGAEVNKFNQFQATRVQWQGAGGLLITSGNLYLKWIAGDGSTKATIPLDASGAVPSRWIAAWHKTAGVGDVYGNLTPQIQVGSDLISGLNIPFQKDYLGNVTIMDPETPTLTFTTPGPGSQLRTHSVVVKGSVSDRTTGVEVVQISGDGVNFTNVSQYDQLSGLWEHTVVFPADGVYTISIRAWDRARWAITFGDYSTGFREVNITGLVVDTRAPAVQITDPSFDFTTRDTTYVVQGFASDGPGGSVQVFRFTFNGADLPASLVGAGYFTVTVTGLREGPNIISVLATDLAGNTNVATRTIVLDTIPPHLIITSPLNNSYTNRQGIAISGENEQDVVLEVNGQVFAAFPYPFTLRQGTNHIWIKATDRGNNTENIELIVTLDRTAPTVIFTVPSRFPLSTRDPHVVIAGNASEEIGSLVVDGVSYPLNRASPTAFSIELYLEDGPHSPLLAITDLANNTLELNAGPIIVDTTPPSLRVDSPADNAVTSSRTLTFLGRTDPNAALRVTSPSGESAWDVNPVTGEFTYTDTRATDGVFPYTFAATDAVGNVHKLQVTVTVDTTKPVIEVLGIDPEQQTTSPFVNFHGTVSPGATLKVIVRKPDGSVNVNGEPVAVDCGTVQGAACTYNFDLQFDGGQTTVTLVATDQAGNQEAREVHVLRTVEAAPVATSVAPYLAIVGLLIGLATLPLWLSRYRSKANAKDPTMGLGEKREKAQAPAQAPAPELVVEDHPQDMYANDAMARQVRAPRPPRGGM
jgi:hypothetical protein